MLVVLGVIFFGPEKLPDLARKLARVVNYLRGVANNARQTLSDELGPEFADLELSDLNPRNFVAKHLGADAAADLDDVAKELKGARTSIDEALHASGTSSIPDGDAVEVPVPAPRPTPFDTEAT